MKFFVVFSVTLAYVYAASVPVNDEAHAPIVRSNYDITPDGSYQYAFETANGIFEQSSGSLKKGNSEYPSLEVQGAYKYPSPDGTPVEVTYTAGEDGYKPISSSIPVPPPIPELIARALAYIASHPPTESSKPSGPKLG